MASTTVPLGELGETTAGTGAEGSVTAAAVTVGWAFSRPRPPLPRRRRRLRRAGSSLAATRGADREDAAPGDASEASGCSAGSVGSGEGSGSRVAVSAGTEVSASKYLGCRGAEAGTPSVVGFSVAFLRRLKRSLIHLR